MMVRLHVCGVVIASVVFGLAVRLQAVDAPGEAMALPDAASLGADVDDFTRHLVENCYQLIESGNMPEAGKFIARALIEAPDNPNLRLIRAGIVARGGNWRETINAVSAVLDVSPDNQEALAWRAYARYRLRDSVGALEDATRLVDILEPGSALHTYAVTLRDEVARLRASLDTMIREGWSDIHEREAALLAAGDPGALEDFYNTLAQIPGLEAYAAAARGFLRLQFGNTDGAGKAFEIALARTDLNPTVRADIEMLLQQVERDRREKAAWGQTGDRIASAFESGDIPGLEKYLQSIAGLDRFRTFANAALGFLRLGEGRAREALADFTMALTDPSLPDSVDEDIRAAMAHASSVHEEAAFAELRDLLALLREAGAHEDVAAWYADLAKTDRLGIFAMIPDAFEAFRRDACSGGAQAACEAGARNTIPPAVQDDLAETLIRHAEGMTAEEEWAGILREVERLEADGDEAGLERLFTAMLDNPVHAPFGLASRGFLFHEQRRHDEAEADLSRALALPALEPATRTRITDALAAIHRERSALEHWDAVLRRVRELEVDGDENELADLAEELLRDDRYRGEGLAARGMLHLRRGNPGEAWTDFREAIAHGGLRPETRGTVLSTLARIDMDNQARAIELTGDLDELESFYESLMDKPDYRTSAIASRGYLRWRRGNGSEATADFVAALDRPDLSPAARQEIENALGDIDETVRAAARWTHVEEEVKTLTDNLDLTEALRQLDDIIRDQPGNSAALANRGVVRLSLGDVYNGRADLCEAAEMWTHGDSRRDEAESLLAAIEKSLNNETPPTNPLVDPVFAKIDTLLSYDLVESAGQLLAATIELPLDANQEALQSYYLGEIHWRLGDHAEAATYYRDIGASFIDPVMKSEAMWKLSTHALECGDAAEAASWAEASAYANPDDPAALARTGLRLASLRQDDKTIYFLEEALRRDDSIGAGTDLHRLLAAAYLRSGASGQFRTHMRRHIDDTASRLDACGRGSACDVTEWYRARTDHATLPKRLRGSTALLFSSLEGGDYLVENVNELFYRISGLSALRLDAYVRTVGALAGSLPRPYGVGRYGEIGLYDGGTHLGDSFTLAAGLRAELGGGVFAALDQVFGIGRDARNDTRLRLGHSWSHGDGWSPVPRSWNYFRTDVEAIYSLRHNDLSLVGKARVGRTIRLDEVMRRLVATPYLGLSILAHSDGYLADGNHWAAEAGMGVTFRRWVREDRYNAGHSAWEVNMEYRLGLSRERRNVLALNLLYSF